jgi:hypothetical protein
MIQKEISKSTSFTFRKKDVYIKDMKGILEDISRNAKSI